jgi:hypothetical protein
MRGIKVCDRWRNSFQDFISDMGTRPSPLHSIDRIDCDGNYEPSNCQWATKAVQYKNRRVRLLHEFTDRQIADEYRKRFMPPPETVYGFNYA